MIEIFHALDIVFIKPSCSIQRGLNQKGMGLRSSSSSICNNIGLWSEESLGKILEEIIFFSIRKELWTKKWSNLAEILVAPIQLLVHVYFPFFGLKSNRSHNRMKFSSNLCMGSLPHIPPFFSFGSNVIFRSPATIKFERAFATRKFSREFQHSLFSWKLTWT